MTHKLRFVLNVIVRVLDVVKVVVTVRYDSYRMMQSVERLIVCSYPESKLKLKKANDLVSTLDQHITKVNRGNPV